MVTNDAKGSFGALSNIGKTTVNSFINIKNKDKILYPEKYRNNKFSIINFLKRNKYSNIEGDESKEEIKDDQNFEEESEMEEPVEEHDIFAITEEEKKNKTKNKNKNKKNIFHKTNSEAYKYHDMNMQKKRIRKKYFTPNCTKYFPKKDFVWHKAPTCLNWDTMQKRKPLYYNLVDAKLLEHEDPLKNIKNVFLDLDKQTMRGDAIKFTNVRIQTARPFHKTKEKNKEKETDKDIKRKKHRNKTRIKTGTIRNANKKLSLELADINLSNENRNKLNKINNKHITTDITEDTNKNIINTPSNNKSKSIYEERKDTEKIIKTKSKDYLENESSSESEDSYHKYKSHYAKQLKINNIKTEYNEFPENNEIIQNKNDHPIIKTETNASNILNKENQRPKTSIGNKNIQNKNKIKAPEFGKIIPREYYDNLNDNGITLIPFAVNNYKQVRERALTMVKYNTKKAFKKKLDYFQGIDFEQYMDTPINYIQHKNYVPMFNKMHTRPMDNGDQLPIYMKGVVSRNVCDMTSNVSLKMNSFMTGKTRGNYSTCLPKKSFNKVVNLNLMNYQELKKYMEMNQGLILGGDDNYIIKSIKFYNRNYRELLKETTSNFDNITYKTIKSKYEYNLNA